MQNTDTTKYIIHSKINADGVIERPDIVGAIFGQTEGFSGLILICVICKRPAELAESR